MVDDRCCQTTEYTGNEDDIILKDEMYVYFKEWRRKSGLNAEVSRDEFFKLLENMDSSESQLRELDRIRVYRGYLANAMKCARHAGHFHHDLFESLTGSLSLNGIGKGLGSE